MKVLFLHVDYIKFKALKKALKNPPELTEKEKKEQKISDALVAMISVEKADSDIGKIVSELAKNVKDIAGQVKAKNIVLYPYAHLSSSLSSPEIAIKVLEEAEEKLKKDFNVSRAPFGYYKEFELKVKGHPLSELSREIRIEETGAKIEKSKIQKEKKVVLDRSKLPPNDHRILGEDMKIFAFSDDIGPGLVLWLPNGEIIRDELMRYMREIETKREYKYVTTPHITKGIMYEKTGHIPYYAESMYSPIKIDGVDYYLKPMNCPHHHMIYKKLVNSYRDLPFKLAEAGTVYRNELSGVTYGLIRVRGLTQNDAHIYMTPEQLKEELLKVVALFDEVYKTIGIKNYWFRLSLPDFKKNPDKFAGNPEEWKFASNEIKKAMKECGKKFVEVVGEASFYGPKIDVQIKNTLGKEETIATCQVDIIVPKRLGLEYADSDGKKKTPIVIHRAILGTYERFMAYLLEQTEGRLPLWLSPVQVRVLSFTDRNVKYAEKIIKEISKEIPNLRIDADFRNDTVQGKVKDAEIMRIPYIIVVGDREEKEKTLAVRIKGSSKIEKFTAEEICIRLKNEIKERK